MHRETYDQALELKRNELGLRFLYEMSSNATYTEFLNILDDREDQTMKKTKEYT